MEQLTEKMDLNAKCPHCGEEDYYTFHLGADTLICNKCDKEFNIELWVSNIKVKSSK